RPTQLHGRGSHPAPAGEAADAVHEGHKLRTPPLPTLSRQGEGIGSKAKDDHLVARLTNIGFEAPSPLAGEGGERGNENMNLLVFGATGPTGQQVVKQALGHGHTVTAFVRNPETLPIDEKRPRVVIGDTT